MCGLRKIVCVLLTLLLLPGVLAGCGQKNPADKNFRYWIPAEPATLDPQVAAGDTAQILIDSLYEGLVRLDASGAVIPGMALKWEASEDYKIYTFYLHHSSRWSDDKTLVTADDFVFGVQRALSPDTGSLTCEPLYCIKNGKDVREGKKPLGELGVKALNTFTLEVTLEESMPGFLEVTLLAPFMPCNKKLFESSGGKYGLETETTHSNGPFRVAKNNGWRHDTSIRVVRSAAYQGSQEVLPAQVMFLMGDPPADPVANLADYKFDALELTRETADQAREKGMDVLHFEDTTWALCFNTSEEPFGNANVRKALTSSINREELLTELDKGHDATDSILPPITTFSGKPYTEWNSPVPPLSASAKECRAFLEEGLSETGLDALPAIKILVLDDLEHRKMGDVILKYWQESLGYAMNVEPVPLEKLQQRVSDGDYQAAICPLRAEKDGPYSFLSMFTTDSLSNPAFLRAETYDKLLDISDEDDPEKQADAFLKAEDYLSRNAVVYPLYNQGRYYGLAPSVTNIVFRPFKNSVDFVSAGKLD